MKKNVKILLFTRSLNIGGAERQLVLLAKSLHARGVSVAVMVYYGDGPFRAELDHSGVSVIDLKKYGRWDIFGFAIRTIRAIRDYRPDVIYTFIGAHLVASTLSILIGRPAVIWGVRASNVDFTHYDLLSWISSHWSVLMSRFADAIICNSDAGQTHILKQGYVNNSITVIPNGIDTSRFMLDLSARVQRCQAWRIPGNVIVVGIMARIDPMKDHSSFLLAAKSVLLQKPNTHFVCIGTGNSSLIHRLQTEAENLGISPSLHWIGYSHNPVQDYAAIDIIVQASSFGEGFPNSIGEAMACGLPVVATDVGDCRQIVGNCGWIVPPKDPQALAQAILKAIEALPNWQHERSRQRVIEHFSVDAMVDRTLDVLQSVVKK